MDRKYDIDQMISLLKLSVNSLENKLKVDIKIERSEMIYQLESIFDQT